MIAAQKGNQSTARVLIQRLANLDIKDKVILRDFPNILVFLCVFV